MNHERLPRTELDRSALDGYIATFVARRDLYAVQLADGRYASVKKHINRQLVDAHLRGNISLGVYALDADSQARWLCFDADTDERWAALGSLAAGLHGSSVPSYLELSRRGGHLWLFTSPMPGQEARRFGQQLLTEHGIDGVEVFPKQDRLATGPGSLVRLPLGRHQVTGRRYHFVTPDGEPLAPTIREQVRLLAEPQRVPRSFVEAVLGRASLATLPSSIPWPEARGDRPPGETLSERIKAAISVHDFVGQFVALDARGRGLCPFHDDYHKSFGVNAERNFWHCYACGVGGSLIDFWMQWRERHGQDASFATTVRELAEMLL